MKRWFGGLVGLLLAAAAVVPPAASQSERALLPDYGAAPEFHDSVWLNSPHALRLSSLRGQVVLLEMWTFGCINCIRTLPYVEQWHETYADQGLVVIGNHYPEFSYEQDLNNLKAALVRLNISYPVLQDNLRETWTAYNNRYWPTIYLIDKQGQIRYRHIGEGRYAETEQAIQALLAEAYPTDALPEPLASLSATVDALNVRGGPGTDQPLIGSIGSGEVYAVLGEQDGWYTIRFQGVTGYVSGEYVQISQP
ncbi:MAG: SH3 domain-containing protein [Anaerolineae bacterium]|nr:SH3 domain-containing protein [Anaerolineae bacterium]